MPTQVNHYLPVLMALGLAAIVVSAASVLSSYLGPRKFNAVKLDVIECGVPVQGSARRLLSIKFYLTAILFILFDIETVFLYLWASVFDSLGWFGVLEALLFVTTLVIGYVYIVKRGALNWE